MLLLKRTREEYWCHVAGRIENDEVAWQTFLREVQEETGLAVDELYSGEYIEQFYEPKTNCITIFPVFVGMIDETSEVRLNEEHTDHKWCTLEEAINLVPFPNQKAVYTHVWKYFVDSEPSVLMKIDTSTLDKPMPE